MVSNSREYNVFHASSTLNRLASRGVNTKNIRIDDDGYYHIPIRTPLEGIDTLPHGYAYKGGVARWALAQCLGQNPNIPPRDMDIIRVAGIEPNDSRDHEIATKYMPDDFMYGYGVDIVETADEYFSTRDFTISEAYVNGSEIVVSAHCLSDSLESVIRFSDFEWNKHINGEESKLEKLTAKAIRFAAESDFSMLGTTVYASNVESLLHNKLPPFQLALQLKRAWERDRKFAQNYVERLCELGHLPPDVVSAEQAANILNAQLEYPLLRGEEHHCNVHEPENRAIAIEMAFQKYEQLLYEEGKKLKKFKLEESCPATSSHHTLQSHRKEKDELGKWTSYIQKAHQGHKKGKPDSRDVL